MTIILLEGKGRYNASIYGKPSLQASGKNKYEALGKLWLLLDGIKIKDYCGGGLHIYEYPPQTL